MTSLLGRYASNCLGRNGCHIQSPIHQDLADSPWLKQDRTCIPHAQMRGVGCLSIRQDQQTWEGNDKGVQPFK